MKKKPYSKADNPKSEAGYTLVETLVASAILLGVLVPAIVFLGKATGSHANYDLLLATQLARAEMEETLLLAQNYDEEKEVLLGKRSWRIVRIVINQNELLEIRVSVYKAGKQRPLVELRTSRTVT